MFTKRQVVSHVNVSVESVLDGGQYACTASNKLGTITYTAGVSVVGDPVIRSMSNVSVVEGDTVWIPCSVLGSTAGYSILWSKGQLLSVSCLVIINY